MDSMLLDAYFQAGKEEEKFVSLLNRMTNSTSTMPCNLSQMAYLHKISETNESIRMYYFEPGFSLNTYLRNGIPLKTIRVAKSKFKFFQELKEVLAESKDWLYDPKTLKLYCLSSHSIYDCNALTRLNAIAYRSPSFPRACAIADAIYQNSKLNVQLILRNQYEFQKVYAMRSPRYTYMPDTIMLEMIKDVEASFDIGKKKCEAWSLDHNFAEITMSFPEKAREIKEVYESDFEPCVRLQTSSTGKSSIAIQSLWKCRGSYVIFHEYRREHRGEIKSEELLKSAKEAVFQDFYSLPERICELMQMDVTNVKNYPNDRAKLAANRKAIAEILRYISKELKITQAISKKYEMQLMELIRAGLDPSLSYTVYDFVETFITADVAIENMPKPYLNQYRKVMAKLPFLDFSEVSKSTPTNVNSLSA